jgi:hypothetical protein
VLGRLAPRRSATKHSVNEPRRLIVAPYQPLCPLLLQQWSIQENPAAGAACAKAAGSRYVGPLRQHLKIVDVVKITSTRRSTGIVGRELFHSSILTTCSATRGGQHVATAKNPDANVRGIQMSLTWCSEMRTRPWSARRGRCRAPRRQRVVLMARARKHRRFSE